MVLTLDKLPEFSRFKSCTQGIVGRCIYNNIPTVWKVSKKANFTCEAEYETGKAIQDSVLNILPNFVKVYGCEDAYVSSEDKVPRKCLLMEYIKDSRFYDVIKNCGECEDVINLMLQVLISTAAAQDIIEYTHYDLHIENILVKETEDDIYAYIFPDGRIYTVKTYGLCAVTIDYGYSYTSKATSILPSLYHNTGGFQPYHFSPLSDVTTFLCSIIHEFKYSKSQLAHDVKRLFKDLPRTFEWKHGWLEGFIDYPKAITRLLKAPFQDVRVDSIFTDEPLIADMIHALIPLPLEQDELCPPNKRISYPKIFYKLYYHWFLVEEELSNPELEALLFKTIINALRESKDPSEEVKRVFKKEFEIDYEVITKCIYDMVTIVKSYLLYMERRDTQRRNKIYSRLPISSALDAFVKLKKEPTKFNCNDNIKFFDLRNGKTFSLIITEVQAKQLNNNVISLESLILKV